MIAILLIQKEPGDCKSEPISSDSLTRPKRGAISRFLASCTQLEDCWSIYQTTEELWHQNIPRKARTIRTSKSKSDMTKQRKERKQDSACGDCICPTLNINTKSVVASEVLPRRVIPIDRPLYNQSHFPSTAFYNHTYYVYHSTS